MGMSFSCPLSNLDELDSQLDSFLVKQISFGGSEAKTGLRSPTFDTQDSASTIVNSLSSGKMILRGSLNFDGQQMETNVALNAANSDSENRGTARSNTSKTKNGPETPPRSDSTPRKSNEIPLPPGSHRHQAAVKLQKTYKSFRTRRRLADCAVLVEQRWWKLLDFAELQSSVSFFDIEKQETAVSRWSRARKKAAKVGKGLSKAEKARKLALQHWLEAIDPRHRYGHNLQFYYVNWLHCESKQPFFYWLDVGEGKEANLEKCPRSKLQQQCIKYLGPKERTAYEVVIEDGKFIYKQNGELLDTRKGPEDTKWIFVLSVSKILYVGQKKKGTFQHSSFLAGGATLSAGRLVVEDGILKAIWPHSGHYLPTEENIEEFMTFLKEHNVDLNVVQREPGGEEEQPVVKEETNVGLRNSKSEPDLSCTSSKTNVSISNKWEDDFDNKKSKDLEHSQPSVSRFSRGMHSRIAALEIPKRENIIELFKEGKQQRPSNPCDTRDVDSASDGYETAEENLSDSDFSISKKNLFDPLEEEYEDHVPKEKIVKRINSHRRTKSYQLAYQLSCRWTTGAGPRIGCVRDYPSELQCLALEEMHLSPRAAFSSPRRSTQSPLSMDTPVNFHREPTGKSPLAP